MTGPEHYQEAERLIEQSKQRNEADEFIAVDLAEAQVHATLALVAATTATRFHTPQEQWGGTSTYVAHDDLPGEDGAR